MFDQAVLGLLLDAFGFGRDLRPSCKRRGSKYHQLGRFLVNPVCRCLFFSTWWFIARYPSSHVSPPLAASITSRVDKHWTWMSFYSESSFTLPRSCKMLRHHTWIWFFKEGISIATFNWFAWAAMLKEYMEASWNICTCAGGHAHTQAFLALDIT